jgi:hypothetical protein
MSDTWFECSIPCEGACANCGAGPDEWCIEGCACEAQDPEVHR